MTCNHTLPGKEGIVRENQTWTAVENDGEVITFDVTDNNTGNTWKTRIDISALPLMFLLGGLPETVAMALGMSEVPWSLMKRDGRIDVVQ